MPIRRRIRTPAVSTQPESEGVLLDLQHEQRLIADELEDTFRAYDQRLRATAQQIASAGSGSVAPDVCERLRTEQLALWRLLRRAQAAQRNTRDLARELREWREQGSVSVAEGHPDHPETRREIVESELRARGIFETPSRVAVSTTEEATQEISTDVIEEETQEAEDGIGVAPEWEHETDEQLLREIYGYERELARTTTPVDIVDLLKGLRTLHGHLRVHDRRQGRPRLRWQMGMRPF